ncbi:MAG: DUF1343 domain-containing protein [Alistipes sp.]|nr:DUF1343 domain-containing protein [Alistipes sp.]
MKRTLLILLLSTLCTLGVQASVLRVGAERMESYLPRLEGHRVALLANHTSLVGNVHLVDTLCRRGVNVTAIFSPEHGFRGVADAGEKVASGVDEKTGIPIRSLYDGNRKRPSDEVMRSFDVLLVDLQDVGLRFYTYYITMLRMMEACAEFGLHVIILDRPNPNGMYVDGPLLDMRYKSGVGALPIPVVHGMTMGEIARMAVGEGWSSKVSLTVVPVEGYTRSMRYVLPVAPSPNLRTQHAIYLYPAVCLFEGTIMSLGRGTESPFEMYGHPEMTGCDFRFTPHSTSGAKNPPLLGQECHGVDLRKVDNETVISEGFTLQYVIDAYRRTGSRGEAFFTPFFEKLVGVDYIRKMIIAGASNEQICAKWQDDIAQFCNQRKPYLLYAE